MKLFTVDFDPIWPTNCCLVILANNIDEAIEIADNTIKHITKFTVTEVQNDNPGVVVYLDGNY